VITSRTRARRGSGDWIEIARKHRAFIPDGLSVPSVGEVGECWGSDSQWAPILSDGVQDTITTIRKPARAHRSCWGARLASFAPTSES
jgi:hypothetical protein